MRIQESASRGIDEKTNRISSTGAKLFHPGSAMETTPTLHPTGGRPPGNAFKDPNLSDGATRTFALLCELDRGPRGCFARRETLARMRRLSVSAVNHHLGELRRAGYIIVDRAGRKQGDPGVIRVVPEARDASGMVASVNLQISANRTEQGTGNLQISANTPLQKGGKLQESATGDLQISANAPYKEEDMFLKAHETTNNTDAGTYSSASGMQGDGVVVSQESEETCSDKAPPPPAISPDRQPDPELKTAVTELTAVGMGPDRARALAVAYGGRKCRAAVVT